MRVVVLGLGVQGRKRIAVAGGDVVATVDPVAPEARFRSIEEIHIDAYDAALVCTPDSEKLPLLHYLLDRGKHVLVEKPLLASDGADLRRLADAARAHGAVCYTAYNHRFEPHLIGLKHVLEGGALGDVYLARLFYGNGTAMDVRRSPWRDTGTGVLADLGSHLLDITLFLFGAPEAKFEAWAADRFENRAFDYFHFGCGGRPVLALEVALVAWRSTFSVDVFGSQGSAHVHGLCKWGPSTLTVRHRVFPSGRPQERSETLDQPDPTWAAEYAYFGELCGRGGSNLDNDIWIGSVLSDVVRSVGVELIR